MLMVRPLTTMQATPAIDMRENRAPIILHDCAFSTRLIATRKHGMPPIQIAAPNWCRNPTSRSGVR